MDSPTKTPEREKPKEQMTVSVVRITDPTVVQDSIEVLDQDVVNLDSKGFEIKRVTVPFEESCLICQWTNSRLRTRTRIHPDFDAATVLGPDARGSLDGAELHPYAIMAAAPGADGEIIVDSGYSSITLLVPPHVLEKHLTIRGGSIDIAMPDVPEVWHPAVDEAREHFELGVQIADAAEKTPEVFNDNRWARYGAQAEFMDSLLATIESCDPQEHIDTDKKGKNYSEIVRKCEDLTLNLDGRRPYLSELCEAANVSERTLQYAFRDIIGMSPLTYLHRLRLHRARDELRQSEKESTTVTDIALNWGFWHFGEFSRAYKNCFGEAPSSTLKRQSGD
jgi:AraC-like DNA-binding protein